MTLPAGWKIDPESVVQAYREKGLRPKRGDVKGRCMCALDALEYDADTGMCEGRALPAAFVDGFVDGFDNHAPVDLRRAWAGAGVSDAALAEYAAEYATGYANGQAVAQHVGATLGWEG